jgi:hypothetical protein
MPAVAIHGLQAMARTVASSASAAMEARVTSGRRRGVLVDAANRGTDQHDAVAEEGAVDAALEDIDERHDRERPRLPGARRRPQKVDAHRVAVVHGNRPAGGADGAGARGTVEDAGAARVQRGDREGHGGQRLSP